MQPRMLADIMGLMESDYVVDRLRQSNIIRNICAWNDNANGAS